MFSKSYTDEISNDDDEDDYTSQNPFAKDAGSLIVGQGVVLNGSLQVPNKTLVSGSLNGELQTKSLTVESYGHITGKINCENADIAGHVGDDLTSTEFLILRSSSVISGDIFYKEMQIDKGAKITGKLIML